MDWIDQVLNTKYMNVSPEDLDLIKIVDTAEEVVDVLDKFYKKYTLSPNF